MVSSTAAAFPVCSSGPLRQVRTFNTSLNDMSPLAISLPPYQKASAYLQHLHGTLRCLASDIQYAATVKQQHCVCGVEVHAATRKSGVDVSAART